jgi:hypothetical protein
MIEQIICAANHYDDKLKHVHCPKNIKTGFVICGHRHHNCINIFSLIQKDIDRKETVKLMNTCIQGFLTNTNRFVNRKEAMKIVLENRQVKTISRPNIGLQSEDLY